MTQTQKSILQLAQRQGGNLTKQDAVNLIGGKYYCNAEKHVGDVLSRMVNEGMLQRIKPGQFVLGTGKAGKAIVVPENQTLLF